MSVAFRRDSDEEHREPRFELPVPAGPNLVTRRGLALIVARVAELEAELEREADTEHRSALQRDLRYWRGRHATAQLVAVPSGDTVAFGSRVMFRMNGVDRRIDIVGDDEADPRADRIAFSAPLARTLIGAAPEDVLDFAGRRDAIEVVRVEPLPDGA